MLLVESYTYTRLIGPPLCPPPACGVAHQALEEINPKGDDILVQGMYVHVI